MGIYLMVISQSESLRWNNIAYLEIFFEADV